jgi:rhodanese-related sulfurtransferase
MKRASLEALCIILTGLVLAFAANALSPRGLKLSRNYFPAQPLIGISNSVPLPHGSNSFAAVAALLKTKGLQPALTAEVRNLYEDPRYQQNFVIFIDARDETKFQEGHIPGAWQFDYYHPERYLATILPLAQLAHEIVVYCGGGDCEDSQLTASFLKDAGIPADKIRVYVGGVTDWGAAGLPLEMGERGSGRLKGKVER